MSTRLRLLIWPLAAGILTLPFTIHPFNYGDEWWHIALGQLILQHGIPSQEPFSFMHISNQWIEQQWLFEAGIAKLYALGGAGLVSLIMGIAGSAALVIASMAVPAASRISGPFRAAAIIAGGIVAFPEMGVRGEVVTDLFLALTLVLLSQWHAGHTRVVWLFPPLFLFWANLHAGFIFGLALMGMAFLLDQNRKLFGWYPSAVFTVLTSFAVGIAAGMPLGIIMFLILAYVFGSGSFSGPALQLGASTVISGLVTLINPSGAGLWRYILETLGNPLLSSSVSEWQSPDFHYVFNRIFAAFVTIVIAFWVLNRRPRAFYLIAAGFAATAALDAVRNVPLFVIIAIPQVAEYAHLTWQQRRRFLIWSGSFLGAVLAATYLLFAPPLLSGIETAQSFESSNKPKSAADFVAIHYPGQRILSTDIDAGYLAFRFPAARVVFMYDEIGLFGQDNLNYYLGIVNLSADDWMQRIQREDMTVAVLPSKEAITQALRERSWKIACYDKPSDYVVLVPGTLPAGSLPPASSYPGC